MYQRGKYNCPVIFEKNGFWRVAVRKARVPLAFPPVFTRPGKKKMII
jgi:hypothetical protein